MAWSWAGVTGQAVGPGWITTSAPVVCQDVAISPLVMPLLTIPAKVARLSASTSANAGSDAGQRGPGRRGQGHEAGGARAAGRQPEQAADGQRVQPQHDQHHRDRHQHRRHGQQQVDLAAGLAHPGRAARSGRPRGRAGRDLGHRAAPGHPAAAGLPRRRDPGRVAGRGGLAVLPRRRSRGTGQRDGQRDPGQQPAQRPRRPRPRGSRRWPAGRRSAAAGTTVTTVPRASRTVTCRSDPPRARSMVSSSPRRTTTIRAASRITAAAITIRLTDSSSSTVSTPAWVLRNIATSAVSGR